MKKTATILHFLTGLTGLILTLLPIHSALAEFSVIPAQPYERQFNFEIPSGQSVGAGIIVNNLGNNPITVSIYGADGTNSSQGTFSLTSRSHEQKHIGTWVKLENETVTIPAKQNVTIPFSITVPTNVTPGNYGGGIAVEASSAELKGEEELTGANTVSTAARIYIRTFIKVPGDKIEDYQWTDFSFSQEDINNKSRFFFSFKNNGNTIIIVKPEITFSGFPPLKESTLTMSEITLQPGTSLDNIEVRWEDTPPIGYYIATAKVDFTELDITNDQEINATSISRSITINLTPKYIIVLILLILLASILFFIGVTLAKIKIKNNCIEYKVKRNETITSIAKKHKTSWQTLAKINKIKSPYIIKEGQIIFIPPIK